MKRLYIIVEGQSEEEFVKTMIAPYMQGYGIFSVIPVLIHTSRHGRGGFVSYEHLKNDAKRLLAAKDSDIVVSMLVDFFRCPELPGKEEYMAVADHSKRVEMMEKCIAGDIGDRRFIPYIQLHEFEALLYASNAGFEAYFSEKEAVETAAVISDFPNPELINTSPDKAPSKRLLAIRKGYDKVIEGNLIALEVGLQTILNKCPRFRKWLDRLVKECL